eukprot:517260_1
MSAKTCILFLIASTNAIHLFPNTSFGFNTSKFFDEFPNCTQELMEIVNCTLDIYYFHNATSCNFSYHHSSSSRNNMLSFNKKIHSISQHKSQNIEQAIFGISNRMFPIIPECIMPTFYCETAITHQHCNETQDRQYLDNLYTSTNGAQWTNSTNWNNSNMSYCHRYGVLCCRTPSNQTCINGLWLHNNNLSGQLPEYPNSSTFTMLDIGGNYVYGTLPKWKYTVPNLVKISISGSGGAPHKLTGSVPDWPSSNCLMHINIDETFLNGSLPDMTQQIHTMMFYGGMEGNGRCQLSGSLPNWKYWLYPMDIMLPQCKFEGSIPPWNKSYCPLFSRLLLERNYLSGTMPDLPAGIFDIHPFIPDDIGVNIVSGAEISLYSNALSGWFPWQSLKYIYLLNIGNNEFDGEIKIAADMVSFFALNVTNNRFYGEFPCMEHNKNLTVVDFRNNQITSIDMKNCGGWPNSTQFFLSSNNALNMQFNEAVKGLYNLSVFAVARCNLRGIPDMTPIRGDIDRETGDYLVTYDNPISCAYDSNINRKFSISWIFIGTLMRLPFPSYTNQPEKELLMAIVPEDAEEIMMYLILPIVSGFVAVIIYGIFYCTVLIHERNKWIQFNDRLIQNINAPQTNQRILKLNFIHIVFTAIKFLFYLSLLSIISVIVYFLSANYVSCGRMSLKFSSITYLGEQTKDGFNYYTYVTLGIFTCYQIICIYFIPKLLVLSNNLHHDQLIPISNIDNDETEDIDNDDNETDAAMHQPLSAKNRFCRYLIFIILVTILLFILLVPLIIYNIFHSLPTQTTVNMLNSEILHEMVPFIVPVVLSFEKWFLIPYVLIMLLELISFNVALHNKCRNVLVQMYRFISMVIAPLIILFVFDNGCLQQWKHLWPYCVQGYPQYLKNECYQFEAPSNVRVLNIRVCTEICDTKMIWASCLRRFFEVLAPLYIFKMILAVWYPILFLIKQTDWYHYVRNKMAKICCCTEKDKNIKIELEYVSLIGSLEIVVVFGYEIPVIVILYLITLFGSYVVYSYLLYQPHLKIKHSSEFQVIAWWLIISIVIQQLIAILFYWQTQSETIGFICLSICFIMDIVLCITLKFKHKCF